MNEINTTDNPEDKKNEVEKTIDESAMADSPDYSGKQAGQGTTGIPNPYKKAELPSGKEPIKIGSGTIVGVLGTGGMAKVYKIWNEKLEVYRAVKILLPSGGEELTKRFETEAKITAKLHHPNIVEIYNVGDWKGLPYLEMEIIEGIALDAIIGKHGRLPDSVCCAVGIQIAKALAYAHSQEFLIYGKTYKGIIHRDLKPANIMISEHGDLKLMDFGIARPTEVGLHTMEGHIVGTLQYLSPEQLDGVSIDKRSDIYSFGAILYEVITGTKTFPQNTITNLMRMKATNSYRRFNEFEFQVNPALIKITEKCLQIDRNNRYENASDLLDDLRKAHQSMTSYSPRDTLLKYIQDPSDYTVSRFKKRIPGKYIIIGSAAAVVIIAATLVFILLPGKRPEVTAQKGIKSAQPVSEAPEVKKTAVIETTKTVTEEKPDEKQIALKTETRKKKPIIKKPREKRPTIASKKNVKKPQEKTSPLAQLQKKYETDNLIEIGEKACKEGKFTDAIKALEAASEDSPKKSLLLLWAYVETKNISKARKTSSSFHGNDAFAELLRGRIEVAKGNDKKALTHYEASLTKPSILKNRTAIRNDALYYIALVHDEHYRRFPSSETRLQALTAWNNLKKVYSSTPNHPRFKKANQKLATTY